MLINNRLGAGARGGDAGESPEMRARRRVDQSSREFNISLWRIATGKYGPGGVTSELATLTGMKRETIRTRVDQAGRDYPPGPVARGSHDTVNDCAYRDAISLDIASPATREFLQDLNSASRKRPDFEDARVSRERVVRADGTVKLISLAIDLPRN